MIHLLYLPVSLSDQVKLNLSNDECDCNKNGKKAIVLDQA